MKYIKLPSILLLVVLISSCLKDNNLRTYSYYEPVYATVQEVRDNVKSKPAQPIENMGGMIVYNNYIMAIEVAKGIHIIDATNKISPTRIGFIPIPGCTGLAIRNNYLYANSYMDLFVIDIANTQNVELVNVTENVFNSMRFIGGYSTHGEYRIVRWDKKDTMVSQEYINGNPNGGLWAESMDFTFQAASGSPTQSGGNSTGGSMARFTLVNDNMYAVDRSDLYSFSLSNPAQPVETNKQNVGWNIETIYPFKDKLFIGSSSGMFIYSISNPSSPVKQSEFSHVRSCDPVIANDKYAFVTLRSGTACQGFTNQMEVLNVENITVPVLLKTYPFTNPHGLGLSGNTMFLCDGQAGLRVLDASDPLNITETMNFDIGIATDVILLGNTAYVTTLDKVLIYEFSSPTDVVLKGSINK